VARGSLIVGDTERAEDALELIEPLPVGVGVEVSIAAPECTPEDLLGRGVESLDA
jgi:hypothetical protein